MKHKLHKINLVNIISHLFIIYMLQWVTLATYLKWGEDSVLVIKIIEEDGTKFVVKIWCKVCAKYISEKLRELNGSTKTAALAFLDGMENIKSSNVNIIFYSIFFKLKVFVSILFSYRIWSVMLTFNIIATLISLVIFYVVTPLLILYFQFLTSLHFHFIHSKRQVVNLEMNFTEVQYDYCSNLSQFYNLFLVIRLNNLMYK